MLVRPPTCRALLLHDRIGNRRGGHQALRVGLCGVTQHPRRLALLEAAGDGAEVLELVEEAFDSVALCVDLSPGTVGCSASPANWLYAAVGAAILEVFAQAIAVIGGLGGPSQGALRPSTGSYTPPAFHEKVTMRMG